MKNYVLLTGVIFGLITAVHIWRFFAEPAMARTPWFIALTLVTAALSVWSFRLAKRPSR
jgi:hypothetical protein